MKTKMQNLIRNNSLLSHGFGVDAMKKSMVCPNCHSLESSEHTICSICNEKLSRMTLYDLYKSKHKGCSHCGAVLSAEMHFCPRCGRIVELPEAACSI